MVDYGKLAERAKQRQDAEIVHTGSGRELKVDPKVFFERVKAHILKEMNKANTELRKRGADCIGQNHLSGFDNEIFLTYGTSLLCRVTLNTSVGKCLVTAAISGPPNGYELSRREYPFNNDVLNMKMPQAPGAENATVEPYPEDIAVDIVSSILVGAFD
jgi:hypothetical protein